MSATSVPVDVQAAEDHLMRFLGVEGLPGQEKAIGEAVIGELKKVGVAASAVRFDKVHEPTPVPTQTGTLRLDSPGTRKAPPIVDTTPLDTVTLGAGANPNRHAIKIDPAGTATLGGDNRTGCAVLLTLVD